MKKSSHQERSSCSKTLSIFSACYFLIENVLYSELIIGCYNMAIKDLPLKVILGYELIAKIKLLC